MSNEKIIEVQQHPEAKLGEAWIANTTLENYNRIGWETKRLGVNAYTVFGDKISGDLKPCFVTNKELVDAGVVIKVKHYKSVIG